MGEAFSNLDIVQKTAISSDVPIKDARNLKFLRLKISGLESNNGLDLKDGFRQSFKDGIIEIKVDDISGINTYPIPYSGGELKSYIRPEHLIQSNNPEIIMTSKGIIKNNKDPVSAAKKINNWVYTNLKKVPTVSVPNSLDVLKTKAGDCNEHTALFTALARAAGIPAKIALGVVFMDGKFYYHAWNEVYVGEWIAADPTLGQFPADASHVKLIEGNFNRSAEIIKVVGKLKLDVIETSYSKK